MGSFIVAPTSKDVVFGNSLVEPCFLCVSHIICRSTGPKQLLLYIAMQRTRPWFVALGFCTILLFLLATAMPQTRLWLTNAIGIMMLSYDVFLKLEDPLNQSSFYCTLQGNEPGPCSLRSVFAAFCCSYRPRQSCKLGSGWQKKLELRCFPQNFAHLTVVSLSSVAIIPLRRCLLELQLHCVEARQDSKPKTVKLLDHQMLLDLDFHVTCLSSCQHAFVCRLRFL